jgi:hypothetical protein
VLVVVHLPCYSAGTTLGSFVIAITFFLSETFLFKTMNMKGALSPLIVAGKHFVLCAQTQHELSFQSFGAAALILAKRGT